MEIVDDLRLIYLPTYRAINQIILFLVLVMVKIKYIYNI